MAYPRRRTAQSPCWGSECFSYHSRRSGLGVAAGTPHPGSAWTGGAVRHHCCRRRRGSAARAAPPAPPQDGRAADIQTGPHKLLCDSTQQRPIWPQNPAAEGGPPACRFRSGSLLGCSHWHAAGANELHVHRTHMMPQVLQAMGGFAASQLYANDLKAVESAIDVGGYSLHLCLATCPRTVI